MKYFAIHIESNMDRMTRNGLDVKEGIVYPKAKGSYPRAALSRVMSNLFRAGSYGNGQLKKGEVIQITIREVSES